MSEKKVEHQEEKEGKGTIKEVVSGDTVVIFSSEKNPQGPPKEIQLTLRITAPMLGRPKTKDRAATVDQPFAWDSREFLRKKCIGKAVSYTIQWTSPHGRNFGLLFLRSNGEDLTDSMITAGWAKVQRPQNMGKEPKPELVSLIAKEEQAVAEERGMHSKVQAAAEATIRSNKELDLLEFYNSVKGESLKAIIERVNSGSSFRVTVLKTLEVANIVLSTVSCPGFTWNRETEERIPEAFAREAKYFVESRLLSREVDLVVDRVDKYNAYGRISFNGHPLDEELLKVGLAQVSQSLTLSSATSKKDLSSLRSLESEAQKSRLRIWSNYVEPTKPKQEKKTTISNEFKGKVAEIVTSGSLAVLDGNNNRFVVNLSSVKVPRMGNPREFVETKENEDKEEPKAVQQKRIERAYSLAGKEFMRKRCIGKKVQVNFDYSRDPLPEAKDQTPRAHCTVLMDGKNIAEILLKEGLASVIDHRSEEPRSHQYEVLMAAESFAKKKGKGIWGPDTKAPLRRTNDLTLESSPAKSKSILPFLQRSGEQKAIVDYVFNGGRFKLTLPKESCTIFFSLAGVRIPKKGEEPRGGVNMDELSDMALSFSREKCHQREVEVMVEGVDKGGGFIGTLSLNKKNLAVQLLENGLASAFYGGLRTAPYGEQYKSAEQLAKATNKNLWKNFDPKAEEEERQKRIQEEEERSKPKQEFMEVTITEIIDGSTFYVQQLGPGLSALEELMTKLAVSEESEFPSSSYKAGDKVKALFSDGTWYRGEIKHVNNDDTVEVLFVDYGNVDAVKVSEIRPLQQEFKALPPQAHKAVLAYISTPDLADDFGNDAAVYLREITWNKQIMANVEQRDKDGVLHLTLGDPESQIHVNAAILRNGLGTVVKSYSRYLKEKISKLKEEEEKARVQRLNIWQYGDLPEDDPYEI